MALRVSTTSLEVVAVPAPEIRVSNTYLEVITTPAPEIRVSSIYLEVVCFEGTSSTPSNRRRRTWVAQ